MNLLTKKESQIHLANNMLLKTQNHSHAEPLINAKTAHGHHAQLDRPAKTNVGLLTTKNIMPQTTITSPEPLK